MPFTANMTGTVQVDDSIREEFTTDFIVEYNQANVMDQFVQFHQEIGAKSISMPRFSKLAAAVSPLTEDEDAASVAMSDSEILFTPKEYGNVITTTALADLQTGGRSSRGAVQLIGKNMAESRNAIATAALEATSNVLFGGDATDAATLEAGDVMTGALLNKIYNKLARANVPTLDGGLYVAFLHDDVIADLRASSAQGSWEDLNKYNDQMVALKNEVGIYKGFRIVRNNHASIADGVGVGGVDAYTSTFMGYNGLGLAESQVPELRAMGPFDKLGRFVNVGWYGVYEYKIVEPDAVFKAVTTSGFEA